MASGSPLKSDGREKIDRKLEKKVQVTEDASTRGSICWLWTAEWPDKHHICGLGLATQITAIKSFFRYLSLQFL